MLESANVIHLNGPMHVHAAGAALLHTEPHSRQRAFEQGFAAQQPLYGGCTLLTNI